jgi:hypothetical protein
MGLVAMRRKSQPGPLSVCELSYEMCVTMAEIRDYLDDLAVRVGRFNVYTIDERVRPEVIDGLRRRVA